jgi:TRAP-type C4-dicarboxylate transport system permease small subunit
MSHADHLVGLICRWGVIACMTGLFFLLALGVMARIVPIVSVSGYDEIIELLFAWLIFLGALALWRENGLYRVMIIEAAAPLAVRRIFAIMTQALMLVFALTLAIKGQEFLQYAGERTPFLGADKTWWYLSVPLTGAFMSLYSAVALLRALMGRLEESDGSPRLD